MASFKPTIITKKGHALMAKIVAGKATPKFTKISVSDHEYSSSTNFESVTNLSSIKQTTLVSSVSKINSAAVKVSGALSNAELSTGYYLRTIGLYATDPSEGEILYSITTATKPDWIPPNNGVSASSIMIDLITVVSNASNVSIDVDPNATATVAQINDLKDEMDKNKTVPFSTSGKSVTSYLVGTKGLFYPEVKGTAPLFNVADNGMYYSNWKSGRGATFSNNGVTLSGNGEYNFARIFFSQKYVSGDVLTVVLGVTNTTNDGDTSMFLESLGTTGRVSNNYYIGRNKDILIATFTLTDESQSLRILNNSSSGELTVKLYGVYEEDKTNNHNILIERAYGLQLPDLSYDLVSRGKNLFDGIMESGDYTITGGTKIPNSKRLRSKNKTLIKRNTDYTFNRYGDNTTWAIRLFDDNEFVETLSISRYSDGKQFNSGRANQFVFIEEFIDMPVDWTKSYMLAEGHISSHTPFEAYKISKNNVNCPRPMLKVGDVEDIILSNGDLVYKNSKVMKYTDTPHTLSYTNNKHWRLTEDDYRILTGRSGNELHNIVKVVGYQMTSTNFDDPSIRGQFYIDSQSGTLRYVTDLATDNIDNLLPFYIYYQLAEPQIIHHGEQGYQAPSPLPAYQNGDLVLLPKHHKKYQANSTTTITLDEEICDLDYARTEIDGKVIDLDCTLESDGKTVTIPETTGWVDIKGTIPSKNCLNPEICADMPANLGTITSANTTSIANLQQKYDKHENIQDLINLEMDYRLTILENK